jgi:hypothetical protein
MEQMRCLQLTRAWRRVVQSFIGYSFSPVGLQREQPQQCVSLPEGFCLAARSGKEEAFPAVAHGVLQVHPPPQQEALPVKLL